MKWKLFLTILLFTTNNCLAQMQVLDSLAKVIADMPMDTVKINKLNSLIPKLLPVNLDKATLLSLQSISLSKELKYDLGLAAAYRQRGVLYFKKGIGDSAKLFYDSAWNIVKDSKDKLLIRQQGMLKFSYGTIFQTKNKLDSAMAFYIEASKIYLSINEEDLLFAPYSNLSVLYSYLKENEKALEYAKKANVIALRKKDLNKITEVANNFFAAKLELKQYDSVETPLRENIKLATQISNFARVGLLYNLLGQYYNGATKNNDSAIINYAKAISYTEDYGTKFDLAAFHQNLGVAYLDKKDYSKAAKNLKISLELAKELGVENIQQYAVKSLSEIEEKQGNYKNAFYYLIEYNRLTDSINTKYNKNKVAELETKYETQKKENQLKLQQSTIKQKNTLNILFGSIAATILGLSLFGFKNYKHKQNLQQQKIAELETQQQLTATEAILKGEEQERTRLAKDLHDGLGGMLSGIKYSFNTMKGNMIMTPDNAQAFERSMDMLDSSIKEMRRVAHNMMPEALVKFGLDTALKDFCNDIQQSGALHISYQSIGLENTTTDQTVSITIYRIVQELINNTMKHAVAKNAIVQVTKIDNLITVTVEDDGKGFDKTVINTPRGMGWGNITNRVEFLKGKIDVDSQHGKGTSVHIEINI
jgi:two-component system, NarL family, sensor kinase